MRLTDLPRTTSFRLAVLFLLLFGTASVALFGFLYWQTRDYLVHSVDDWLAREQSNFLALDQDDWRERLAAHVIGDPTLERPLMLLDPTGHRVAGTSLNVPASLLASLPKDRPVEFSLQQGGHDRRFRALAHRTPSGDMLVIAQDMRSTSEFADVLVKAFTWGGLVTVLLGLAGASIAGADAVRRINGVTLATRRIVSGDLSSRLPTVGRSGDLDRLTQLINGMLDEIERLMQEVKGVCDNIAHDLRTPLTRLLAGLERAGRRAHSVDEYAVAADEAAVETRGILKTFAAMLRISEIESTARRAGFTGVDLSQVVADVIEFYEPMAEENGISLQIETSGSAAVMRGDPSLVFEAIANLVDNALKFTPRGGRVTVRTLTGTRILGIDVTDNGPGIPANEREAVLRRFHRAEGSRHTQGSGLGLPLVAAVARLHDMELTITDAMPGCRITVACRNTQSCSAAAL